MTKIDIFSGFLGAGKTTLIKKLISEAFQGEKLVLIENEFGEIAIDGGFLQDAGIEITEMSQGCICCSLVGDFGIALRQVMEQFHPDRILIEPSGVGKLSDVIRAVQNLGMEDVELNSFTTVADAKKVKMYAKNFGEFYNDQIAHANSIVLSRTTNMDEAKLDAAVELLREANTVATIITTPWEEISGKQILEAMEHKSTLTEELKRLADETAARNEEEEAHHHHHHHHGHDEDEHDEEHGHDHDHEDDDEHEEHEHHHHHEDEEEHEHHHHHDHDDDDDEEEHEHHHHHDDDDEEHEHHHHDDDDDHDHEHEHEHHHHHHHHHHHDGEHDADEIFESWGMETSHRFTMEKIEAILKALDDAEKYGIVLRAKGIVAGEDGQWIHFDYVPGEADVRHGSAIVMGRFCVIGSELKEAALKELFA